MAIASVEAFLEAPLDVELVRRVSRRVTSPGRFEVPAGTPNRTWGTHGVPLPHDG